MFTLEEIRIFILSQESLGNVLYRLYEEKIRNANPQILESDKKYSVEEIRNYILSQDSLGDVLYKLSDENIQKASCNCQKCHKVPKLDLHPCPFDVDVKDDCSNSCNCCESCQNECYNEI